MKNLVWRQDYGTAHIERDGDAQDEMKFGFYLKLHSVHEVGDFT